jgi:hypothetical protein
MEYNVKDFPKKEFLRLWDLVLIARDGVRMPFHWEPATTLYRVSDRLEDFCETNRPALASGEFVGMYVHDGAIWMKPDESFRDMQDTALHEIAHHEVPHEAHGPTWRKVFGTAYVFYLRELGYDWGAVRHTLHTGVVSSHRVFRSVTDPVGQKRIIDKEVTWIIRHAQKKMPVLTERGRSL